MKKLHGIFLYLMLAVAPAYSISITETIVTALFGMVATKGIELAQTRLSLIEGMGLLKCKDTVVSSLSIFIGYIDYFGGEKCGLWKSNERLKREAQDKEAEIANHNREETHRLSQERALDNQKKALTEEFKAKKKNIKLTLIQKINSKDLENKTLEDKINHLVNQQKMQLSTDEWNKIQAEKDKKHAEEIAQLNKKLQGLTINKRITELEQENQKLAKKNNELKTKSEQRSMFTNINSFTVATQSCFNQPSVCPNCKAPINQINKNLLRNE
jgi:hypothetical protein